VPVQGEGAAEAICAALARANRRAECDLLILARGGGSLEDLMAFNDEALAHGIRASAIPVLTGIGHEIDLSIADLVADQRAPTPSAAAELAVPSAAAYQQRLEMMHRRLTAARATHHRATQRRLDDLVRRLKSRHPAARLEQFAQTADRLGQSLERAMRRRLQEHAGAVQRQCAALWAVAPDRRLREHYLQLSVLGRRLQLIGNAMRTRRRQQLGALAGRLEALSPLAVLGRGYAIVSREQDGAILRSPHGVDVGESIGVRLAEGRLLAKVVAAEVEALKVQAVDAARTHDA
jgi:exodeoxyribonuclease VII large subunit